MSTRVIPITVENEYVAGSGVVLGSAGSAKDVALLITFGESWDGYNKRINWVDSHGGNATLTLLTDNLRVDNADNVYLVPIPAGPKTYQGNMMVTIQGYTLDGSDIAQVQVTTTAYFKVLPSDWKLDDDESVTPTVAQQLQAAIDAKQDVLTFDNTPTSGSNNPVKSGGIYDALALKAPLASPSFSGNPTVPDRSAGDNSAKIANTKYVDAAVAAEKSRAQGVEATKAPLASPALTGNPTAPTQNAGDNSTKIATTGYTDAAVAAEAAARDTAIAASVAAAISGGSIFIAKYGETTLAAISAALTAGKTVLLDKDGIVYVYTGSFAQYYCFAAWSEYNTAYTYEVLSYLDHINYKWACVDTSNVWASGTIEAAKIASPEFSGTPKAPTAAAGTNNTQIATTEFVRQEINGELSDLGVSIVNGALCQTYTE